MAALEIATFWGGELLFLDYVTPPDDVPGRGDPRLGWSHDGMVSTHCAWVPDAERLERKSAPWGESASAIVVAIVLHVGLLGLGIWIHNVEEDPQDLPPELFMLGTLAGNPEIGGGDPQETSGSATPTRTARPATRAGKQVAPSLAIAPEDDLDPAHFGMIGLLAGIAGDADENGSGWGRDVGDLFGRDVPSLGPDLSGVGQGGGGPGAGIALGNIGIFGTCDDTGCVGSGYGSGFGHGRLGGSHRGGIVCTLPVFTVMARNHLPPEIIQRIVRQNMGRFRGCYEDGLATDPSLAGRVVVKFMIGRDGSVTSAQDAGSNLPDSKVVACIARAYQTISFPESEGAIGVTYPLELSPD